MGYALEPSLKPNYNNDITDPVGQFQAAVDYAEAVGNHYVGSTTLRNSLLNAGLKVGTEFRDTTEGRTYLLASSGWELVKPTLSGTVLNRSGDASGFLTVTHNLGIIPKVFIQPRNQEISDGIIRIAEPVVWGLPTATQFTVRWVRRDTGAWFFDVQRFSFDWMVAA